MGTTAYERVLAVAVAALHERDPERLWPLLAAELPVLCGGDALIYKLDNWDESEGTLGLSPEVTAEFAALGDEDTALLRAGYPLARHYADRPDRAPVTARRVAGRSWSGSPTARLLDDLLDVDHVLGVPLPRSTTPVTGCMVYRSGGTSPTTNCAWPSSCSPCWPPSSSSGSSCDGSKPLPRRLPTWRSHPGRRPCCSCSATP